MLLSITLSIYSTYTFEKNEDGFALVSAHADCPLLVHGDHTIDLHDLPIRSLCALQSCRDITQR